MFSHNFYHLAGILIFLGLIRYLLVKSHLNSTLAISLGCALTFCFFENIFRFLPLVFCLLKGSIEEFFSCIKTFLSNLKEFIFSGKSQTGNKPIYDTMDQQVLLMEKKGKEGGSERQLAPTQSSLSSKNENENWTPASPLRSTSLLRKASTG